MPDFAAQSIMIHSLVVRHAFYARHFDVSMRTTIGLRTNVPSSNTGMSDYDANFFVS